MNTSNALAIVPRLLPTSLGVIRSLSQAGVRVIVVDHNDTSHWVARTRLAKKAYYDGDAENLVDALLAWAGQWRERPALLLTTDKDLWDVSASREELEPYYRFILPEHSIVDLLLNKRLFAEYASNRGYPVPDTFTVTDFDTMRSAAERVKFPCVLKPYMKKASRHFCREELLSAYESLPPNQRDAVVQEWIPGGDNELYFCFLYFDRKGELKARFSARKIRQWPLETGSTSFAESVVRNDLIEMSVELFREVGYVGYGSVEYKRDAQDGTFKIMEPTVGRFDLQIGLATACGLNIPFMMYCDLTDRPPPPTNSQREGVKWLYEAWDYQAFSKLRQRKNLSWLRWVWSLRGSKTCVAWDVRDPKPTLRILKNAIRGQMVSL